MAEEHAKFEAEVLTPEGPVFSGELVQLSTRTAVGDVGILAKHVPMVARLWPALLRLHMPDGEVRRYAQGEGWLEVFANQARVLVVEAMPPDELDVGHLRELLADSDRRLKETEADAPEPQTLIRPQHQKGSAANQQAWRDHRRAEAFLKIAEGG